MERDHTALHGGEVAAAALLAGIMLGAPQPALAQEDLGNAQSQATAACAGEPDTQAGVVESDDSAAGAPIAHAAMQEPATSEEGVSGDDPGETSNGQNAAENQPAASSDAGTYENAGLYQVAIRYVNAQGEEIAPTAYAVGYEGEWSVPSPALDGYTLVDPGQSTVSGAFSGEDHDPAVTVTYRSSLAKYTVIYERKVADGYEVMERVEKDPAEVGSTVSASTPSFAGYHCVATEDELTTTVTSDGLATIVVRYEPDSQSRTIFFETGGGTYIEPITGQEGDAIEGREDPTRPGYTFAGWDTDGDGAADALPSTMPESDVTATALWAPAQAAYTVEIYGENKGSDGYHLIGTIENLIGKTESAIAAADSEDPLFDPLSQLDETQGNDAEVWQYYQRPSTFLGTSVRWEGDATIKGDGSSVAKVYYDWRLVTVYFMDLDPDKYPASSAPVWGYWCATDQVKEISSIKVKPFTSIEFPNAITAQLKGEAEDGQDYQKNGSWYPLTFMYWAPFERTENTSFKSRYSTQDVYNTFRRMGYSYTVIRRQYRAFRKVYETYCAPYVTSWQDSGEYEGETVQYQGSGTKTLVQRNNGRTIVENDRLTLDEGYFQDLVVGRWKVGGAIYPELDDQLVAYFMPLYHARKYAQEVKDGYVRQDENGDYDYSNVEEHPTHVVTDPGSTMGNQRIGEHEGGEGYVPVAWRFSKTPLSDGNPQWEAPAEGKAYLDGVDAQDCWQQFDKVEDDGMYCAGDTQGYTVTQWLFNRKSYTTRYFLNSEELGSETGIWGRQLEKAGECQQLAATKPETAGLVFVGWFDDNGNQVTDLTIPIGGEDLYARFAHPDVQVVFEADGGAFASGASGTAEDPGATETSRDVPYGKSFNASSAAMPADPVREGYSFGGWWYFGDDGTGTPARFSFDYNLKNDVVLHAAWKANPSGETTYRVVHIAKRGAGRTVLQEETLNGHVGDSVTALALDASSPIREGLRFCDGLARTITLDSNAEGNVIEFVYEDPASNNFTVRYLDAATGLPVAAERSFDGERPLQDESAVAVEGYTVRNGGRGYLNAARAGGNVLTFLYDRDAAPEPDPVPTPDEPDGSGDSPSRTALHQAAGTPAHQPQHAAGPAHASAQLPKTGDHAGTAPAAMAFFGSLLALLGSSRKRGDHEKGRSRS